MRIVCPFSIADVERADGVQVTPRLYANATFEGIKALRAFSEAHLRGVLQGLLATTEREQAVLRLYYRLAAYLATVYRLDSPIHFQSIAGAARSIFELALDLALIHADTTTESITRLNAFTRVERYRVAKRLVDFYANRPVPPDFNITEQSQVCADAAETAAVEGLITQFWDHGWPTHWSRFGDARSRAAHVGARWEERYVRHYSILSWQIHSSVVGVAGLAQELFDVFVADAHRLARDSALDAYDIVGQELHLAHAMDQWAATLEFLRNVSGMALVELRLQALGEPPRFQYLDEHEQNVV